MTKNEIAIQILKENAIMINSLCTKQELKHFKDFDFVEFLIKKLLTN